MPVLADQRRPPDEHNPRGYFEYEPVKRLAADASWIEDAVGRAVKVVYLLLRHLPPEFRYRVLFLERDLAEVFDSQQDMLRAANDPAADQDRDRMLSALAASLDQIRHWLARQSNMKTLIVPYAGVLEDPGRWSIEISEFLDGLAEQAMTAAVDPSLARHSRS